MSGVVMQLESIIAHRHNLAANHFFSSGDLNMREWDEEISRWLTHWKPDRRVRRRS